MPDQSSAATEHAILQEITAPLDTLPDDPMSMVDADFATTLRGYDRVAVDEYVRQTRRLVAELHATRSPEAAVRRALERVGDQVSGVLQRAHETAEQITTQSRSEAEDRLEQARSEGAQITAAAEQRVADLDADTDRIWIERQRIVADAEDLAGQLLALAKVAAERFPADEETSRVTGDGDPAPEYVESSLVEGIPVEAGAAETANEDQGAAGVPAQDDEEITRTVAFSPLERSEDETAVAVEDDTAVLPDREEAIGREPSETSGRDDPIGTAHGDDRSDTSEDTEPPRSAGRWVSDDHSTGAIPPASQAANRRFNR